MTETTAPEAPKRAGRPRGSPKTGGRRKGVPNRTNAITRDFIIKEGAPIAFLCNVVKGRRFTSAKEPGDAKRVHVFPTMDQRLRAAEILARKVTPDLKSQAALHAQQGEVKAAIRLLEDFLVETADPSARDSASAYLVRLRSRLH